MKYTIRGTGQKIELTNSNFRAAGGEGKIYIVGDTVYKVCDKGKMIPDGKFQELAVLNHSKIIRPQEVILDTKGRPVGYTMKLVPDNAIPLVQILTKTYREREGVTQQIMNELVKQIGDAIKYIHSHPGYLQVDGNELNYMITSNHKQAYLIDVNSFQTPHYPADAIMPSIRDWNCSKNPHGQYEWSQLTDWYSFAIISFYMFCGIHPFKGRNPKFPDLKTAMIDQMKAGVSVFDTNSQFPQAAVYYPFEDYIPGGKHGAYMQWYRAIFCDNKRLPAPTDFQAVAAIITRIKEIIGSNTFNISLIKEFPNAITSYYNDVIVTTDEIYWLNQPKLKPSAKFRIGINPFLNSPFALVLENGFAKLLNLSSQNWEPFNERADDIMSCDGRLYYHYQQMIYEVNFPDTIFKNGIANVMPNATRLFQGVAIQNMFGNQIVSIFPKSHEHRQIKIAELDACEISDAKFEGNVLMVIGFDKKSAHYTRFIFRFSEDWMNYDIRKIENLSTPDINFTTLDNGICICLTEEEKIEIFSSQKDAISVKSISDPSIKANMRLCHSGSQARFAYGNKLYNFSVKKGTT